MSNETQHTGSKRGAKSRRTTRPQGADLLQETLQDIYADIVREEVPSGLSDLLGQLKARIPDRSD